MVLRVTWEYFTHLQKARREVMSLTIMSECSNLHFTQEHDLTPPSLVDGV